MNFGDLSRLKIWNWKQESQKDTLKELEKIIKEAKARQQIFAAIFSFVVILVCVTIRLFDTPPNSWFSFGPRYLFGSLPLLFVLYQRRLVKIRLENFKGFKAKDLVGVIASVQGAINTALLLGLWDLLAHASIKQISMEAINWFLIAK